MRGLDARCEKLLWALHKCRKALGYWPTYRQVMALTGIRSTSTVYHHRSHLARAGMVNDARGPDGEFTLRSLALDYTRLGFARIAGERVILERVEV